MKKPKADLLQGTLELLILRLLRSRQLNGWEITQQLQALLADLGKVPPNTEDSATVGDTMQKQREAVQRAIAHIAE